VGGASDGGALPFRLGAGENLRPVFGGDEKAEGFVVEPGVGRMGVGGGPRIVEWVVDHVGANGVLFDVAEGAEEVGVAEEAGVEAVLPESAGAG